MHRAILPDSTRPLSAAPPAPPAPTSDGALLFPPPTESTTTVVIGSGLSGLAVASELCRKGVDAIVVEGLSVRDGCSRRTTLTDAGTRAERCELLRLLRGYAESHSLDIRSIVANDLQRLDSAASPAHGAAPSRARRWAVTTQTGVLLADNIVLTGCPMNQLRRLLRSVGLAAGRDFAEALRSAGLHLVGVGGLLAPTTREIAHQAKLVTDAIAGQAGRIPSAATA